MGLLYCVWWLVVFIVGGTSLVDTITTRTNLDGISTGGTIRTFISAMAGTLRRKSGMSLVKFKAFSITREDTEANVGPSAGTAVAVPTGGMAGFGPNTRLTSTVGWLLFCVGKLGRENTNADTLSSSFFCLGL